jgi:large subunit ribosomal protein L25
MKKLTLAVEERSITGRKVKNLRKQGILPGTIYGKDIPSVSIQLPIKEFEKTYKEVGETGLIYLELGTGKQRPVLIKHLQTDPRYSLPLNVDFYQVNLSEKVSAMVPVVAVGEPKAVSENVGLLLTPTTEVEVEALPTELPENIEVEISHLAAIGDQITVADLKPIEEVTVLTDPGQILFKIDELVVEEPEPEVTEEAAAEGEAGAEAPGGEKSEEGSSEDGEKPQEEEKKEE